MTEFRYLLRTLSVVPAKAGTHNHRPWLWLEMVAPSLRQISPCGYGSRICAALVRDDSGDCPTPLHSRARRASYRP